MTTAWTYRNWAPAAAKPACSGLPKAGAVAALAALAAARLTVPAVAKAASKAVIRLVMLVMVLPLRHAPPGTEGLIGTEWPRPAGRRIAQPVAIASGFEGACSRYAVTNQTIASST